MLGALKFGLHAARLNSKILAALQQDDTASQFATNASHKYNAIEAVARQLVEEQGTASDLDHVRVGLDEARDLLSKYRDALAADDRRPASPG